MGTLIAWVLVRDRLPGRAVLDTLIDLPFALPTIVAGLALLALYGTDSPVGLNLAYARAGVVVALLFVTLPFVVRTVQPVLLELDRDMEEAAASLGASPTKIFRRIILPNLAAGDGGRHRAGLCPRDERVRLHRADLRKPAVQDPGGVGAHLQPDRERQRDRCGGRCRPCCWSSSLVVLLGARPAAAMGGPSWLTDVTPAGASSRRLAYLTLLLVLPVGIIVVAHLRARDRPGHRRAQHARGDARVPGHARS